MELLEVFILVFSFILLLSLGVPIAFSIGISGIVTMLVSIDSIPALTTFGHRMATGLDSFALLAIPFFILAGNIMNRGGIAIRLIDFARVLVGRFPGGLSFVNVLANMLFGAISGSAAASASAIGTIMGPEMDKEGYDKNFSTAINISSATTGLTIPPSNILIVYSLASGGASVAALFIAGYIPGILTGLGLMIVGAIFAIRKGYAVTKDYTVLDTILTFLILLIAVALPYVYAIDGFSFPYLFIYALWLRAVLHNTNSTLRKSKWDAPILAIAGIITAFLFTTNNTAIIGILAAMAITPVIFNKYPILILAVQSMLVALSVNLFANIHYITSALLIVYAILLIPHWKNSTKNNLFQGTKKFLNAVPSLLLLVIVIGGIIAGYFTATEASAIAVLYALVLAFIYNEVKISILPDIILNSVRTTSIVLLLVATSIGLSWIMAFENIPQTVSEGLLGLSDNPIVILLIINLILLFVGVFMDMTPAVLIFTPIFLPIVTAMGVDPIHFGIIMVLNLSVGLCTPPVGSVLFIGCSVSKISIDRVVKPLLPMYIAMIATLLAVTYIPQLSMWLPALFGF